MTAVDIGNPAPMAAPVAGSCPQQSRNALTQLAPSAPVLQLLPEVLQAAAGLVQQTDRSRLRAIYP